MEADSSQPKKKKKKKAEKITVEGLLQTLMGMKEHVMAHPALPAEVAEISPLAQAMEMDEYMASLKKAIDAGVDAEPHLQKCCIEFCIHGLIKMVASVQEMKSNKYLLKTFNENVEGLEHIDDQSKLYEQMSYVSSFLKTMI
jgi:hypothetical protein